MHLRHFLLLGLFMGPLATWAQVLVQGRVVDQRTQEPLAFVNIALTGAREGAITDIDGRFRLEVPAVPLALRVSYVGYATREVQVTDTRPLTIGLDRQTLELREVEVRPGENPAHRIIRSVHANRRENDALRNRSYRYTSYSKTIFTGEVDSALLADPVQLATLDTNDREALDFLEDHHILLVESATKKRFRPPADEQEEVLAMRVSGLKDPSLLALVASTKTFSIYQPQFTINGKTYVGPIGSASVDHYLFLLEDTLYQGRDSVFVISYQPRSGKRFNGLKGVLWVNTDGYALQNVIAEPTDNEGGARFKLQQQFTKIEDRAWFPTQLNTFIYLDNVKVNKWRMMGVGRTYLKDIELDAPVSRKETRGPELVMDRMAMRRDDDFWAGLRNDTLDQRELSTYTFIDSISEAEGIERKVKWLTRLTTGRAPLGPFDLLLDRLMRYNGYEGLRLGLGAATNDRVTRYGSLGGYFAYGFNDRYWKYGGDLVLKPKPGRELELRGYYAIDVDESGGVAFNGPKALINPDSYRWIFLDRMDRIERTGAELAVRVNSSLKLWLGTERADRLNVIGYEYLVPAGEGITLRQNRFLTGGATLGFRFAYREQLARLPDRQLSLGTRWPVLSVNAFRSFKGLWGGDLEVWRVNAMVEKKFRIRMVGDLQLRVMGGMADTQAPYPFLYNIRGSNYPRFPVAATYTFETMLPNEFLADRYVNVHLRHSFGNLLFGWKKFKPVPVIIANAGWGALSAPERHQGYSFKSYSGGYYEAGLQLDNLLTFGLSGMGVGAFYRLGPHGLPDAMDNLALKVTFGLAQ